MTKGIIPKFYPIIYGVISCTMIPTNLFVTTLFSVLFMIKMILYDVFQTLIEDKKNSCKIINKTKQAMKRKCQQQKKKKK